MYQHPLWLPNRRAVNTYFYSALEFFGEKDGGNSETLSLFFWGLAVPLAVGWALAKYGHPTGLIGNLG